MNTLKFSPANAKLSKLVNCESVAPYLTNKRKVYSFDLLSGHTCPYAKECHSKSVDGKIVDGPYTLFRCFSASQENFYKNVFHSRKHNTDTILPLAAQDIDLAANTILNNLPKNCGVVRIHVGGDFATRNYFDAWVQVAETRKDILFYAYTKSLPFSHQHFGKLDNLRLTASRGGWKDELITKYNLREAVVVFSEQEAIDKNLPIDHDDSHAASVGGSFALLIHGVQPKGTKASKALKELQGKGSYSRKKKERGLVIA